jgi:hypothetical protein
MRKNLEKPHIVRIFTHNQKSNNTMSEHMTPRAKQLFDNHTLTELQEGLAEAYRGMEQEAEAEGGDVCDEYSDEITAYETAIRVHNNRHNDGLSPFNNMSYDEMLIKHGRSTNDGRDCSTDYHTDQI